MGVWRNRWRERDKIEELISEHDTNNEYDKGNITALAGYALKKSVGGLKPIHTNALVKIGNKILNSNEKIDNVTDIFYDVIGGINFNDVSVIDVDFSNFGNKPDGTPNEIWEGNHNDSKDFTNAMKLLRRKMGLPDNASDKDLEDAIKISGKYDKVSVYKHHITINGQKMTWHHHLNCTSMQLIASVINNPQDGGFPHIGGASLAKALKEKAHLVFQIPLHKIDELICK